jgi:hypothetical protein
MMGVMLRDKQKVQDYYNHTSHSNTILLTSTTRNAICAGMVESWSMRERRKCPEIGHVLVVRGAVVQEQNYREESFLLSPPHQLLQYLPNAKNI